MGFWEWLTGSKPQRVEQVQPARRMTVDELADELFAEFPDGIDPETLWDRCEAAGLRMEDVDRRMDEVRYAADELAARTVETLTPSSIVDLSDLDSVRMRIKGQSHWVTVAERKEFGGVEYWLVREPRNKYDKNAVAVYGQGRKVGYISAARAAMLAAMLDEVGADAYLVGGANGADMGIRQWVDVPKVEALRSYVRTLR